MAYARRSSRALGYLIADQVETRDDWAIDNDAALDRVGYSDAVVPMDGGDAAPAPNDWELPPDPPHVDVQVAVPQAVDIAATMNYVGGGAIVNVGAPLAYPRDFDPADHPDLTITDQSGHPVNPADLMVVVDQMGVERVVPKLTATAPAFITVSKPDVITWIDQPGTGGLVQRKYVNGIETDEGRPWKPFDQMSRAEVLAYWTAVSPGDESNWADYSKADGSANLTDVGKQAIAILNAAGASSAATAAAGVAQTTVRDATAGVVVPPNSLPTSDAHATSGSSSSPIYTAATTPRSITPGGTANDVGAGGSTGAVTVTATTSGASGFSLSPAVIGIGAVAVAFLFFGRR